MKPWLTALITVGLLIFCMAVAATTGQLIVTAMILATALWAAIDSSKIELKKYQSGISYSPIVLFFAIALLSIVGFPWYLNVRNRIKTGTAVLKKHHAQATVPAPSD